MGSKRILQIIIIVLGILLLNHPLAQAAPKVYVEVILDASGSMAGKVEGRRKMDVAKEVVNDIISNVFGEERDDLKFALRIYGHRSPKAKKDCKDSNLEYPFGKLDANRLKTLLDKVQPVGYTPIAYSLTQAAKDFPQQDKNLRRITILLTDGIESCADSPCRAAKKLMDAQAFTSIHVIGFGLKKESMALLECITKSSGGRLLGAKNSRELKKTFRQVVSEAVNAGFNITVTVNDKPTAEATITIIPSGSDRPIRTRASDLDGKEIIYAPPGVYDIAVREHTVESVQRIEGVTGKVGETVKHTFNFLRGGLQVKVNVDSQPTTEADIYVFKKGNKNPIRSRQTNIKGQELIYLPIGEFDVQVVERTTKEEQWWKGVNVRPGDLLKHKFDFFRAGFQIKATINNEITAEARFDIFPKGQNNPLHQVQAQIKQPQIIYLPAGTYGIKATAFPVQEVSYSKQITIEAGKIQPIDFNFLASGFLVEVLLNGEYTGDANIEIYQAGKSHPIKKSRSSFLKKTQFILPAGTYDLRALNFTPRQEQWRKGIVVEKGQLSEERFEFTK